MKNIYLTIIALFLVFNVKSQNIPNGTKHVKYIDAVVYNNVDTIEYNRAITYYDSTWNVLTNTNTLASALSKGTVTLTVIDRDDKKMYSDIDKDGDTISSIVYLYDPHGNRTAYYQIIKGDTINRQKRTYDKLGNNLELWNYDSNKYFLKFRVTYDDSNNVVKRVYFDATGRTSKTVTTQRNYKKGTIKSYEQIPGFPKKQTTDVKIVDGISRSNHLTTHEGINYGITLKWEKGGYTLTKRENDNLVWMKIFDPNGDLSISVQVSYEEYP